MYINCALCGQKVHYADTITTDKGEVGPCCSHRVRHCTFCGAVITDETAYISARPYAHIACPECRERQWAGEKLLPYWEKITKKE